MTQHTPAHKGRGALSNPGCRYDAQAHEAFDDGWAVDEELPVLRTTVMVDATRSIITRNDSPDVPFSQSINPYRGCEHGCVYCFARPSHAYLGLSPGLDFETKILIKPKAADLLRQELQKSSYRCATIAMGTNTDPYQPLEKQQGITRAILQVLQEYHHPVSIVTKSALIERDMDLLAALAKENLAQVMISITTLDRQLARWMEPRAAAPQRRLETVRRLNAAGIPTGVLVAPIIPVLNEAEIETILQQCAQAGAVSAAYVLLRLPLEVAPLFEEWLQQRYPLKAKHILSHVRDMRGGKLYESNFGERMQGTGNYAAILRQRFDMACQRFGYRAREEARGDLNTAIFCPPGKQPTQLALF